MSLPIITKQLEDLIETARKTNDLVAACLLSFVNSILLFNNKKLTRTALEIVKELIEAQIATMPKVDIDSKIEDEEWPESFEL